MNLESVPPKKSSAVPAKDDFSMEEFEFKPLTSGLGFHQPKATDIKPVFTDKIIQSTSTLNHSHQQNQKEMNVYQNDLSLFYGQQQIVPEAMPIEEVRIEKTYRVASGTQRVSAYLLDMIFLFGIVGIMLTIMARTISMDIFEVWETYPSDVTPLVLTIFCGFYLLYFSIFDKTPQCSVGKSIMGIRVVDQNNKGLSFSSLAIRSLITLMNFVSLGLFSYFDLQNKVTHSKVIRID